MSINVSPFLKAFQLFFIAIVINPNVFSQTPPFHRDSLENRLNGATVLRQLPKEFIRGIARSNYKKNNKIEYFPLTSLELPSIYLPAERSRPRMITLLQIHQARQNLFREPYRSWHQLLKAQVDGYLMRGQPVLKEPLYRQAEDIKVLAFLYRLEKDERYLKAAVALLEQLPEPPAVLNLEGGQNGRGWGDFLESAQALPAICTALDLIYDNIEHRLRDDTRRKVTRIADQLIRALLYTTGNNHMTVMATAVLSAAMVEDQPEEFIPRQRQGIWRQGLNYLSRGLGLIAPDGGYAEGVYYGRFIMNYVAPLSVYFRNLTGMKLFEHPYLERLINWLIANDKGSGRYTSFDDAFQVNFFILPVIIPQSRLKYNWYAYWRSLPLLQTAEENLVEALCVFELLPNASETTESPIQIFAESGQVIFRDKALQPSLFASFLSEREYWFAARHEQIDPFNIEVSAFGEDLIVEGGYGRGTNDPNRRWFVSAQAHNGILIDGQGSYRNPIFGDPIESKLSHLYQTRGCASASMSLVMSDFYLQRKVYFIENRYFLMIDQFDGNQPHSVGLNFNYLGELQQVTGDQLRLRNSRAVLNLLSLSSQSGEIVVTKNFGLYTPPGTTQPIRSFQLQQPDVRDGYFLSLFYPQQEQDPRTEFSRIAVQGNGDIFRLREPALTAMEADVAVNRAVELQSERWKSDARIIWVRYDETTRITGLLLVHFRNFQSAGLSLESDFPLTIFLEEYENYWQGYIESAFQHPYRLSISGITQFPLRFNRLVLRPVPGKGEQRQFTLNGSGTLEIGNGPGAVNIPYRYHQAPDLLKWLGRQSNARRQYEYWPDYHKKIFQNQLTEQVRRGMELGINYWSDKIFRDSLAVKHAAYAVSGILQESYNRDSPSTFSIQLPHRYQLTWNTGDIRWAAFEEGTFSIERLNIQNVLLQARLPDGKGIAYRGANWFEGHQLHQFQLYAGNGSRLFYQIAAIQGINDQQLQLQMRGENIFANPGYHWNREAGEYDAFFNWQWRGFHGSVRRSQRDGEPRYYESLGGFGRQWAFAAEARQMTGSNLQDYSLNWLYHFTRHLSLAQGGTISSNGSWQLPYAFSELNWGRQPLGFRIKLERRNERLNQWLSIYWQQGYQRFSSSLTLDNFRFRKENLLRLSWYYRTGKALQLYHNLVYRFDELRKGYGLDLYHSVGIPVGDGHVWEPIVGEIFPADDPLQWLGSGFAFNGPQPFYAQVLANRTSRPVAIDYQIAVDLSGKHRQPYLNIWLHLHHQRDRLYRGEIRIQPLAFPLQPGLYYSYLRHAGSRLEGFLEWRW